MFIKTLAPILLLFFSFDSSLACTCSNYSESQRIENLKKTQIVFQGEVVSVSEPYAVKLKNSKGIIYGEEYFVDVSFKVFRVWKGVDNSPITIKTFAKPNSCSIPFQVGMKPTVLANGKPPLTDYCTAAIVEYSKIPELLGEGKVFEQLPENPHKQTENDEGFLADLWKSIISFFS